jgi:TonB family protein
MFRSAAGPGRVYDSTDKGIKTPILLRMVNPAYTTEARIASVEGIVVLEAIVRKDGSVGNFKVLRSLGYGLDESAISTVNKQWKFSPGMLDGKPVDYRVNIEVAFRLY